MVTEVDTTRKGRRGPEEGPLVLDASAEAKRRLAEALGALPAGHGVRIWVETGIHPKVKMMFDRRSPRDLETTVGSVAVFVDPMSRRFLDEARIDFVQQEGGEGFHVTGPNVPGGTPEPTGPSVAAPEAGADRVDARRAGIEEKIRAALKQIYDPEIPMNLVDLGLIYGIDWDSDDAITIRMSLTSVGCPSTEQICEEVDAAARSASGLPTVKIDVVWQPPWTPERMSLFAKRQFGYV
ncbi:MAG: iron-sulfur cluster assembly protein [Thermoplasmata archaeon]